MNQNSFAGFEVKDRGVQGYLEIQAEMRAFTESRDQNTGDQLWLLEHPAVYTQGTACKEQTIGPSSIPVVKSDRGGQITYHGAGQLIVYCLIDLRRRGFGVKTLVNTIEKGLIDYLSSFGLAAVRQEGAPGVYIDDDKIAALGLRVRKGCSYHGLSLNVDMELAPFENINPCGFKGLQATSLYDLGIKKSMSEVKIAMVSSLSHAFVKEMGRPVN
jgi:lipoyl(octanoyl) transferase